MLITRSQEFRFVLTVLFLLFVYVLMSGATQAFGNTVTTIAQAETPSESETPAAATDSSDIESIETLEAEPVGQFIFNRQVHAEERAQLQALYKAQIAKYRTSERQFTLDKQQYAQLQTLVSLEVAVRSTREVYLDRSKVLVTYIELVRLTLQDTPGIELGAKDRALVTLDEARQDLLTHQDAILLSEDRIALGARASEFALLTATINDAIYRGLLLINLGKVQTLSDQSQILFDDILQYHTDNPGSALQESQRTRARQEIERNLERTKNSLKKISDNYSRLEADNDTISRNTFNRYSGDLSTPYSQLSNVLSYLAEFITI